MFDRVQVDAAYDQERMRRVVIYRRPDGCYVFAEEERAILDDEPAVIDGPVWWPVCGPNYSGVYDSPETAVHEAGLHITWLRDRKMTWDN